MLALHHNAAPSSTSNPEAVWPGSEPRTRRD